jgi:hypothetical protein
LLRSSAENYTERFTRRIKLPAICSSNEKDSQLRLTMRSYTTKEKLKITAGAVASLVIVGWVVVLAIIFLSER